jgi:hypothetical protein
MSITVAQNFYQTLNVFFACDAVLFDDEIRTTIALLTWDLPRLGTVSSSQCSAIDANVIISGQCQQLKKNVHRISWTLFVRW